MDKELINQLAKRLNVIDPDSEKEPYILTKEEEESVLKFAKDSVKTHKEWKLKEMGLNQMDIESRISVIDLDALINRDEILAQANSSKIYDLWQKERRENEKFEAIEKRIALEKRCDAKYMYNIMSWASRNHFGKKIIIHEDNLPLVKTLCFFLSGDHRFETELNFSFKKGLLIRGVSGLGKTYLVKCLSGNELIPIDVISMLEINSELKLEGDYPLQVTQSRITYLDDVGTEEPTVNHYGTKISFFKNFIESFYLKSNLYNRLMISTNNSFAEIEEKYGFRVRSRIKDIFNIIDIQGVDMRGNS